MPSTTNSSRANLLAVDRRARHSRGTSATDDSDSMGRELIAQVRQRRVRHREQWGKVGRNARSGGDSPNLGTSTSGAFTPTPKGVTLTARCEGSTETIYVLLCDEISSARSCAFFCQLGSRPRGYEHNRRTNPNGAFSSRAYPTSIRRQRPRLCECNWDRMEAQEPAPGTMRADCDITVAAAC